MGLYVTGQVITLVGRFNNSITASKWFFDLVEMEPLTAADLDYALAIQVGTINKEGKLVDITQEADQYFDMTALILTRDIFNGEEKVELGKWFPCADLEKEAEDSPFLKMPPN